MLIVFWYWFFTVKKSTLLQFPNFQGCSVTATETSDTEITQQQYFHTDLFMVEFILGQIFNKVLETCHTTSWKYEIATKKIITQSIL